jgi:nitrate reductase NapE component
MNPPLYLVVVGLEFPVVMALLDCWQRPPDHFLEGAEDRTAWLRWLVVAVVTVPILLGYGIVLGYYFSVVRRNSPAARP